MWSGVYTQWHEICSQKWTSKTIGKLHIKKQTGNGSKQAIVLKVCTVIYPVCFEWILYDENRVSLIKAKNTNNMFVN